MLYLVHAFLPWLAGCLVGGIVTGALTASPAPRRGPAPLFASWLLYAAGILALAVVVAFLKLLPGRAGLLLDAALLFVFAFFIGCPLGAWLRGRFSGEDVPEELAKPMPAAASQPAAAPVAVAEGWSLRLTPGALLVEGSLADEGARAALRAAVAASLPGVAVTERIALQAGADVAPAAAMPQLLASLARLSEATVTIADRRLSVVGTARSAADHAVAVASLARPPAPLRLGRALIALPAQAQAQIAPPSPLAGAGPARVPASPPRPPRPKRAAAEAAPAGPASKPKGIARPRGGKADDLKRISGIGRQNESRLQALGIWHFAQIAAWNDAEIRWVGEHLAFPGRIEREDWRGQAAVLAAGGETAFARRVDRGEVETSKGGAPAPPKGPKNGA